MIPNSSLLSFGAPLNSAFRSLGPSILGQKNQRQGYPQVPKPPELKDLNQDIFYNDKELAALAKYFNPGGDYGARY